MIQLRPLQLNGSITLADRLSTKVSELCTINKVSIVGRLIDGVESQEVTPVNTHDGSPTGSSNTRKSSSFGLALESAIESHRDQ